MGYDLPAAIGASVASKIGPVVCLAGDGSIMMNLQELQTIRHYNLPIKIFILNNSGYASISQTHKNFFNGVDVGCGPDSGLSFPDFSKISQAFGIPYTNCNGYRKLDTKIESTLKINGPAICEVFLDKDQPFSPKLSSKQMPDGSIVSPNLEDMFPFLTKEELRDNTLD
jgi:acetolactate synthase I/II/III large subunit